MRDTFARSPRIVTKGGLISFNQLLPINDPMNTTYVEIIKTSVFGFGSTPPPLSFTLNITQPSYFMPPETYYQVGYLSLNVRVNF
jgi:hypothetical protein